MLCTTNSPRAPRRTVPTSGYCTGTPCGGTTGYAPLELGDGGTTATAGIRCVRCPGVWLPEEGVSSGGTRVSGTGGNLTSTPPPRPPAPQARCRRDASDRGGGSVNESR